MTVLTVKITKSTVKLCISCFVCGISCRNCTTATCPCLSNLCLRSGSCTFIIFLLSVVYQFSQLPLLSLCPYGYDIVIDIKALSWYACSSGCRFSESKMVKYCSRNWRTMDSPS